MIERSKGCHHCIGTAFAVTNLIFNFLEGRASSSGSLSAEEVAALRSRFLESYSSGYDFFDKIHSECMQATRGTIGDPFARDMILPSLLSACGKRAARRAFKLAVEQCGDTWLDDFFYSFADYIREHGRSNVEPQLIAAFVEAAGKHKSNLTVSSLLQEDKMKKTLFDCITPFVNPEAREKSADMLSAAINQRIARKRNIGRSDPAKTTSEEMKLFLQLFPAEMALAVQAK
jgi:hypothetical protein